jgi:galactokinase
MKGIAHGRVNLIGEHTDYNGGWVLPTSIPQFTQVTLLRHPGKEVKLTSLSTHHRTAVYQLGEEKKHGNWTDYLQGVTSLLLADHHRLDGFSATIESTVPEGSGLSSSAALEVSFLKALRDAFTLSLTDQELAVLAQRVENEFVGARVGIMDQMACSLARAGEALFLDTQAMTYEQIQLPMDDFDLIVINSGISHRNVDGGYNQRRAQCEEACGILEIKNLRELKIENLPTALERLTPILQKRVRHVVTENARVFAAVKAIREKDLVHLGELFYESHASMRDDYQISLPEIDWLVEEFRKHPQVFGARLTGGGFGGSVVALTKKDKAAGVGLAVKEKYESATGEKATLLVPHA